LCLTAPALAGSPAHYTVVRGDNLSLIARRFGVTVDGLRHTNGLRSDVLAIGQRLRVDRPFAHWNNRSIAWTKPVRNTRRVLRAFGPYKKKGILMPSLGVDVATDVGTRVVSPAAAVVRHIGHMDRFGTLIILEHGGGYATVLAPLDPGKLNVSVGQAINAGHPLGVSGIPEPGLQPHGHIELRRHNKAIKPDPLLR
jgi:murein DD-endopeptidase MepM/ murein hydrolase activator NlpD